MEKPWKFIGQKVFEEVQIAVSYNIKSQTSTCIISTWCVLAVIRYFPLRLALRRGW